MKLLSFSVVAAIAANACGGLVYEFRPQGNTGIHALENSWIEVAQSEFSDTIPADIIAWNFEITSGVEWGFPAVINSADSGSFLVNTTTPETAVYATAAGLEFDTNKLGNVAVTFVGGPSQLDTVGWHSWKSFEQSGTYFSSLRDTGEDSMPQTSRWLNVISDNNDLSRNVIGVNPVLSSVPEPSQWATLGLVAMACWVWRKYRG